MRVTKKERLKLSESAALKLLRANEEDTREARADLMEWARASAYHLHEILFAETVSDQLKRLDPERKIDVDALPTPPELSAFGTDMQVASSAPRAQTRSMKRLGWAGTLAAAVAILAVSSWLWIGASRTIQTGVGEQRSVKLPDGSVMVLNTRSHVKVQFTERAREIRLLEGEALFIVERDPTRSFRVLIENGAITAIGTRFNVDHHTGNTRVSVLEGAVQVSGGAGSSSSMQTSMGIQLSAGEQAVISRRRVVKAENPDVPRAVAWRSRQLMFTETPLSQAAAEFNRYNRVQMRVEGEAVGQEKIGGVFDADDVQTLVDFLAGDPRFAVTQAEGEIVIRERP